MVIGMRLSAYERMFESLVSIDHDQYNNSFILGLVKNACKLRLSTGAGGRAPAVDRGRAKRRASPTGHETSIGVRMVLTVATASLFVHVL